MAQKYFAAGAGQIEFNGVRIANITNASWTENVGIRPVQVIGNFEVDEHVLTSVGGSLQVGYVKPRELSEDEMGLIGNRTPAQILQSGEKLLITLKDKTASPATTQYAWEECVYSGSNGNLAAGDILSGSLNYVWTRMKRKGQK